MGSAYQRPLDRSVCDWIDVCVQEANAYKQQYDQPWTENWCNYRVESFFSTNFPNKQFPLGTAVPSRFQTSPINFLKTPESHQGVNTLRALLLASLFGVRDYIQADPVGDEDIDAAKRVSRLIMYGSERPGNFRTNWECMGDALIFGFGSYTSTWRSILRLVPRRVPVPDPTSPGSFLRDPQTGSIMSVLKKMKMPVYDDVALETDDIFKTWFDPSADRMDQVRYKIKQFQIPADELKLLKNDPDWDGAGIDLVLQTPPEEVGAAPASTDNPKLLTESLSEEDVKTVKEYGIYSGWYFEGQVPPDIVSAIGGPIDANGTIVLRMINGICVQRIQSTQKDGLIQGGSFTILPTGRGLYGLSPLSVVRYLQDVSDTQLILTVQALIESVYQNYITTGDMGPNFARTLETRRPREVLTIQGEVQNLVPLPKDYAGLQIAVGALNLISQTMRNAMNARDPVQGIMKQTGESTATETQLTANAALQNTDQLAILIERDELPRQGRLINDLYYIHLDDESKVFRRVGESETTNVNYFDIDSTTDIYYVGARSVLNKTQKASQFRDFATLIASNPFTAAAMDWHTFVQRYGDEVLDVKGLEQLMIKDPEEIISRMQAAGLANTVGRNQNGGPGPSGGAPPPKGRRNPANGGRTGGLNAAQAAGEPQ